MTNAVLAEDHPGTVSAQMDIEDESMSREA